MNNIILLLVLCVFVSRVEGGISPKETHFDLSLLEAGAEDDGINKLKADVGEVIMDLYCSSEINDSFLYDFKASRYFMISREEAGPREIYPEDVKRVIAVSSISISGDQVIVILRDMTKTGLEEKWSMSNSFVIFEIGENEDESVLLKPTKISINRVTSPVKGEQDYAKEELRREPVLLSPEG